MSQVYTLTGEIGPLDEALSGTNKPFFRKELDIDDGKLEVRISTIIKENQGVLRNIVTIYDIRPDHIDMELLDMNPDHVGDLEADMRAAIAQLHSVGVVYVDLKMDNIGYSHTDKRWKIFDFDASGIVSARDDTKWDAAPPAYYMYKKYRACVRAGESLKELDRVILEEFLSVDR